MKASLLWSALFSAGLTASATAAEETPAAAPKPTEPATVAPAAPKQASEETIRARLLEHSKIKTATRVPAPPASSATGAPVKTDAPVSPAPVAAAPSPENKAETAAAATAKAKADPAAVMPRVEVTKPRITVLDHQLAEQEKEIAHEKKLTKSTDLDKALNSPAASIRILGGESTKYRTTVASERVSLMESEKDIIEAIAHAKTKEEKAELQKELSEIKALRRDLEKALR